VFEDEIEVYVSMLINGTAHEDGKNFLLVVEVVDEKGDIVQTLTNYKLGDSEESRIATFTLNPSELKAGYYKLRAKSKDLLFDGIEETIETTIRKLEKKRESSFYVDHKTKVAYESGKPFFPLGIYTYAFNDTTIDNITDSPFNLIVSYRTLSKSQVDYVYERSNGRLRVIHILATFKSCSGSQAEIDENYTVTVNRINELKESPGLFGYYVADEPNLCLAPLIRNISLTIRDLDPKHFSYAVFGYPDEYDTFKETSDVMGVDPYPCQFFTKLESVYINSSEARKRTCNSRGMWHVVQIFDWERYAFKFAGLYKQKGIDISQERPPSEQQLRQMVYQYVAGGAMGIIFYLYDDLVTMNYKNPFNEEWAKVKKVVSELSEKYVPIILSTYPGNPRFSFPYIDTRLEKNYFGWRKFYYNGFSYLLIVNILPKPQNFSFTKPDDLSESDFEMIMGSSKMTFDGNNITLEMPSTEVVWLRVYDKAYMPDQHKDSDSSSNGKSETHVVSSSNGKSGKSETHVVSSSNGKSEKSETHVVSSSNGKSETHVLSSSNRAYPLLMFLFLLPLFLF